MWPGIAFPSEDSRGVGCVMTPGGPHPAASL